MLPLTVKHSPKTTAGIVGQDKAILALKDFILNFKKQRKRGRLLYGPPGSGKTCSAYALAKELNLEILEVNASDCRNEEKLNATVGQASKQLSLFGKSKILLVDEVDGVFGQTDRGAVPALINLVKTTAFPVIFTANDPWDKKFSQLRTACELVEFKQLDQQCVLNLLRKVCDAEKIAYEEKALASLARRSGGDVRGALIDLHTLGSCTTENLDVLGDRHQTDTIFNTLMKIFKTTDALVARTALEDLDEDMNQIFLWIDENVPKEYTKPLDLVRAYEKISRADVFRGRIMRRQHWHFLAVISILLSAGIALSKDVKYTTFVRYGPTQRLLKIWRANQHHLLRKSIAEKLGRKTHCNRRQAFQNVSYLRFMFGNKTTANQLSAYFSFSDEECAWLGGAGGLSG